MNTEFTEWLFPWKAKHAIAKLRNSVCVLESEKNALANDLRLSRCEIELCKQTIEQPTGTALQAAQGKAEAATRAVKALTAWIKADRKLDKASTEQVVMEILRTQTK